MQEKEFNRIVRSTIIKENGWAFKIPDPPKAMMLSNKLPEQNPFDGFGILTNGKPVYWESKYMKGFHSFNLDAIRDHQVDNLLKIKTLNKDLLCIIILCCNISPRDKRVFLFNNIENIKYRRDNKLNYKVKELNTLPYLTIKVNTIIDFTKTLINL